MYQNIEHQKKIMMINDLAGYGRCSLNRCHPDFSSAESTVLSGSYVDIFQSYRFFNLVF